jgi:hypothetical protein
MGWINTLLASRVFGTAESADPSVETAENSAPNAAREALRSNIEDSVGRPEAQISEEIRQRQIVLITRYVTMARAH